MELEPTRNGDVFWKNNNLRDITQKHAELVCTASSETIPQESTAQSFSLNGEKLKNLKMSRRRAVTVSSAFLDSFYYSRETCMTNFKIISHLYSYSFFYSCLVPGCLATRDKALSLHMAYHLRNNNKKKMTIHMQVIYSLPLVEKHWINAWHVNRQTLYKDVMSLSHKDFLLLNPLKTSFKRTRRSSTQKVCQHRQAKKLQTF